MLIFACLLFTTCAASAAVLVLPAFLRRSAWHVLVRLGSALDAFVDPSTTGVAVEQVARRAVLTIVLVSPVELAARAVIGRLRHTERQASRARLGLGGRVWTAPPPADDVVLATKVQARFRRFLVQVQQRKQHQAQTMAALESMDKQRVRLEWALLVHRARVGMVAPDPAPNSACKWTGRRSPLLGFVSLVGAMVVVLQLHL